jgi:hypothetical protein
MAKNDGLLDSHQLAGSSNRSNEQRYCTDVAQSRVCGVRSSIVATKVILSALK